MIFNVTGGGGAALNFKVLAYPDEATLLAAIPAENTIGIITTTPITSWIFSAEEPSPATAGEVWFSVGIASPVAFNALKKNNAIMVCPMSTKQYIGGTWVYLNASIYQKGIWYQFSSENTIPQFTYTGDFEIVNDSDEPITVSQDNWKIRLLTSGNLTFTNLGNATDGIDVFRVGGGGAGGQWCDGGSDGSGGCGGCTNTTKNVSIQTGEEYSVVVGSGGISKTGGNYRGNDGGDTTAFGVTAKGGSGGHAWGDQNPGSGGSGGGSGNSDNKKGGNGGSDGGNGGNAYWNGGEGQGTTTREFGENTGTLYAGGGGGSWTSVGGDGGGADAGKSALPNTGGGGGGGYSGSSSTNGGAGGSGIVIIRNKR